MFVTGAFKASSNLVPLSVYMITPLKKYLVWRLFWKSEVPDTLGNYSYSCLFFSWNVK